MVGSFKKLFDLVLGLLGLLKRQMGEFHPLFLLLIRVHQRTKQLVFPITPKKLNDQKTWGEEGEIGGNSEKEALLVTPHLVIMPDTD